jgi:hypothetical protein
MNNFVLDTSDAVAFITVHALDIFFVTTQQLNIRTVAISAVDNNVECRIGEATSKREFGVQSRQFSSSTSCT